MNATDLSMLRVERVHSESLTLEIAPPLVLAITQEDDQLIVEDSSLGLFVGADTHDELRAEVEIQLVFNWREYAGATDDELTDGAKRLRDELNRRMK